MYKVVEPLFEARDDYDIFADLCRRFGREAEFTGGKSKLEWIQSIYDDARLQGRGIGIRLPRFSQFWHGEGFVTFPAGQPWVRHESFRQEPDLEPLGTPSGLIEIYSKTTTAMGTVRAIRSGSSPTSALTAGRAANSTRCTCNPATRTSGCTASSAPPTTTEPPTRCRVASLST